MKVSSSFLIAFALQVFLLTADAAAQTVAFVSSPDRIQQLFEYSGHDFFGQDFTCNAGDKKYDASNAMLGNMQLCNEKNYHVYIARRRIHKTCLDDSFNRVRCLCVEISTLCTTKKLKAGTT
ncbi:MAG: hypothetical protein D6719_08455 [Candidatus Dadabacteria bacterium]|nr:MAG: hypothetical protein D6719_08455 [Candidatus Dadabacteria bacterium]